MEQAKKVIAAATNKDFKAFRDAITTDNFMFEEENPDTSRIFKAVLDWNSNRLEALELMFQHNADPNASYYSVSSKSIFRTVLEEEDMPMIKLFLEYGANANILIETTRRGTYNPYLYDCVSKLNWKIASCLLEYGANPNILGFERTGSQDKNILKVKELPIHEACNLYKNNREITTEMIKSLIRHGTDINYYSCSVVKHPNQLMEMKYTPLHIAINSKDEELYYILLSNGALSSLPFHRAGAEISTIDLMRENNVGWDLVFEWHPNIHRFLTPSLKKTIETLIKCVFCSDYNLNIDVLSIVFTFICLEDFYERDLPFRRARKKKEEEDLYY